MRYNFVLFRDLMHFWDGYTRLLCIELKYTLFLLQSPGFGVFVSSVSWLSYKTLSDRSLHLITARALTRPVKPKTIVGDTRQTKPCSKTNKDTTPPTLQNDSANKNLHAACVDIERTMYPEDPPMPITFPPYSADTLPTEANE